jgi:hypothetical protein
VSNVVRVAHDLLPAGELWFTDDDVVELEVRHEQIVVEQMAQAGNLSFVYVGEVRYEFDFLFNIYQQSTLQKLEMVRLLRASFTLMPFYLEEPASSFTVFWPEQPTMTERWVRGRRFAQWDKSVTWKETREIICQPPEGS